ncbi:DNA sulfur modification protein DndE [Massilia sp. CFBP9012]|uniref:DNA sulfur modification protein DndE n=1 Tax=Massilia sp. CFBP9012 TaxID=3096531 RepID=UPI002A6B76AF|nr:DNA sulfur modification protein DndE [Massilia sp. CFBP9012]MDY0977707.1 DNA sulfur modification protein DndE [Massilia sp. CFBP9012]
MIIDVVRVSEKAKYQLLTLKRRTGIQQWNVLCRWALLVSLAERAIPPHEEIVTGSNIEMSWKTFAGTLDDAITAVVRQRAREDQVTDDQLPQFFKIHLHRGIAYLLNGAQDLRGLVSMAYDTEKVSIERA